MWVKVDTNILIDPQICGNPVTAEKTAWMHVHAHADVLLPETHKHTLALKRKDQLQAKNKYTKDDPQ